MLWGMLTSPLSTSLRHVMSTAATCRFSLLTFHFIRSGGNFEVRRLMTGLGGLFVYPPRLLRCLCCDGDKLPISYFNFKGAHIRCCLSEFIIWQNVWKTSYIVSGGKQENMAEKRDTKFHDFKISDGVCQKSDWNLPSYHIITKPWISKG